MAKKKSFILHVDSLSVFDELTDAQVGKLFRAIRAYHLRDAERCYQDGDTGIDTQMDDFITRIVFAPFKAQFDRDEDTYEIISAKRSHAGKLGGAPKGNTNALQAKEKTSKNKQNKQNKLSDSDSDSDSDSVKNIIHGESDDSPTALSFENIWSLYEKKGNKKTSERKWSKLPTTAKEKVLAYIPAYVKATPDKQYRKNFETFLNQECWNDELPCVNQVSDQPYERNYI